MIKYKDLPLICEGMEIAIPIESICNQIPSDSNKGYIADRVIVNVNIPKGLEFVRANLQKGTYDSQSQIWSVGSLNVEECVSGELIYRVINDCKAPFKITYTAGTEDNCPDPDEKNNHGCVVIRGLSCCDLHRKCNKNLAKDDAYSLSEGESVEFNVSENDGTCNEVEFKWEESVKFGDIEGDPTEAKYTPNEDFYGLDVATYGIYCSGVLRDTANVYFNVKREVVVPTPSPSPSPSTPTPSVIPSTPTPSVNPSVPSTPTPSVTPVPSVTPDTPSPSVTPTPVPSSTPTPDTPVPSVTPITPTTPTPSQSIDGACCAGGVCIGIRTESVCLLQGGTWNQGLTCNQVNCNITPSEPTGACCTTFETCFDDVTSSFCFGSIAGALDWTEGSDCSQVNCVGTPVTPTTPSPTPTVPTTPAPTPSVPSPTPTPSPTPSAPTPSPTPSTPTPTAPLGSCCDVSTSNCTDGVLQTNCSGVNQTWDQNQTCAQVSCGDVNTNDSCCNSDGSCTDNVSETDCTNSGGTWNQGEDCATATCPQPPSPTPSPTPTPSVTPVPSVDLLGACCQSGSCTDNVNASACVGPGSTHSPGLSCSQVNCVQNCTGNDCIECPTQTGCNEAPYCWGVCSTNPTLFTCVDPNTSGCACC